MNEAGKNLTLGLLWALAFPSVSDDRALYASTAQRRARRTKSRSQRRSEPGGPRFSNEDRADFNSFAPTDPKTNPNHQPNRGLQVQTLDITMNYESNVAGESDLASRYVPSGRTSPKTYKTYILYALIAAFVFQIPFGITEAVLYFVVKCSSGIWVIIGPILFGGIGFALSGAVLLWITHIGVFDNVDSDETQEHLVPENAKDRIAIFAVRHTAGGVRVRMVRP